MVSEIVLVLYLIFAVVMGVRLYLKVEGWVSKLDRITPEVDTGKALRYALLAFAGAAFLELIALYRTPSPAALLILPLIAGFAEEGAKLSPCLRGGDELYRWKLTIKVALMFAVIEAVLYGITLLISGNPIGAILRLIVVVYHVSFTAIALECALRGSLFSGYLKAALLHAFYDSPVFVALSVPAFSPLASILGIAAIAYTYYRVDDAFGIAHRKAWESIEGRKRRDREFWEKNGTSPREEDATDVTSSP